MGKGAGVTAYLTPALAFCPSPNQGGTRQVGEPWAAGLGACSDACVPGNGWRRGQGSVIELRLQR